MSLTGTLLGTLVGELLGPVDGSGAPTSLQGLRVTRFGQDALYLEQDVEVDYVLERRTATGAFEVVTGLGTLQQWYSLERSGQTPIAGTVTAVAATGAPGRYRAILDRAAAIAAFGALQGRQVYEVLDDGTDVRRVRAIIIRPPQVM